MYTMTATTTNNNRSMHDSALHFSENGLDIVQM